MKDSSISESVNACGIVPIADKPGYGMRIDGRRCLRGHVGPIKTIRGECAVCLAEKQAVRGIVERAMRQAIRRKGAVNQLYLAELSCSADELQSFIADGCAAIDSNPSEYGETWEVARKVFIAVFNYKTPAGRRAANALSNLTIRRRPNPPKLKAPAGDRGQFKFDFAA